MQNAVDTFINGSIISVISIFKNAAKNKLATRVRIREGRKAVSGGNGGLLKRHVSVWRSDNERWPSFCPVNPGWPQPQESQLTHHRSVFFSSCFVFLSLLTKAGTRYLQGLTTIGPLPALLASFFLSLAPLFRLLFLASFSA